MRTSTSPQVCPRPLLVVSFWLVVKMLNHYFFVVCFAEKYMKKLFGTSKDQMGVDQKAVLLVSKVNESKRHGERRTAYPRHLRRCLQAAKLLFWCSSSLHHLQRPEEMEAKAVGAEQLRARGGQQRREHIGKRGTW